LHTIAKQPLVQTMVKLVIKKKLVTIILKKKPTLLVSTKVLKPVVKVIAQLVKLAIVPLRYPCIICFSSKHRAPKCLRKTKVHNRFRTKPTTIATIMTKSYKLDNVLINVVITVTTRNQVPKQHVFRKCEELKAKATTD
jgi:hypothetical protein